MLKLSPYLTVTHKMACQISADMRNYTPTTIALLV